MENMDIMGEGITSDKVNINVGGGEGGGGGSAAMIAALLNGRNQDSGQAGMLAALLNGRNQDGGGFGQGGMWPLILLALLGRNGQGGGIFGGGECGGGGDAVNQLTLNQVLGKLGTLEGAIPLTACETQNGILEQTNALTNILNQNNIAQLVATAGVKDTVVNTGSVLLNAGNQNTQAILQAVAAVGTKIDSNTIADLQRQLGVAQNVAFEERVHRHAEGQKVEVNQSVQNTATAIAAQAQQQQQQQQLIEIGHFLRDLAGDLQTVKQGQVIFNSGLMAGSGTQAAANTKVA